MKSANWNKPCPRSVGAARSSSSTVGVRSSRGQTEVRQERQEIREYLDKLRQLVPGCPKAGKLSRLAVIQHVIDYIVELQDTLLHHPVNTILATDQDLANLTSLHNNPLIALQQLNSNKTASQVTTTPAAVTSCEQRQHPGRRQDQGYSHLASLAHLSSPSTRLPPHQPRLLLPHHVDGRGHHLAGRGHHLAGRGHHLASQGHQAASPSGAAKTVPAQDEHKNTCITLPTVTTHGLSGPLHPDRITRA